MKIRVASALALTAASMFAASAFAEAPPVAKGDMFVNSAGMTVYTFDNDKANSGKSVCNDGCAKAWPPVMADANAKAAGVWSIVTRDDGSKQWAYKGKPLYLFAKDTKPGETTGDKFKDVWHVARP